MRDRAVHPVRDAVEHAVSTEPKADDGDRGRLFAFGEALAAAPEPIRSPRFGEHQVGVDLTEGRASVVIYTTLSRHGRGHH